MHTEAKIQFLSPKLLFFSIFSLFVIFGKNCKFASVCNWKGWFLILKNRKLKKFRISRFSRDDDDGCVFEVFCWFPTFLEEKGRNSNKNYSTLANNVFSSFSSYDAQKWWWLGYLMMNLTRNCFRWDLMFQKKNPEKRQKNMKKNVIKVKAIW